MGCNKKRHNDSIQERGRYSTVPNELWSFPIDYAAKFIWGYLLSCGPSWNTSRNNIAKSLGMSVNTVSKHVYDLITYNMVQLTSDSDEAWEFEIIPVDEWKMPKNDESECEEKNDQSVITINNLREVDQNRSRSKFDPHTISIPFFKQAIKENPTEAVIADLRLMLKKDHFHQEIEGAVIQWVEDYGSVIELDRLIEVPELIFRIKKSKKQQDLKQDAIETIRAAYKLGLASYESKNVKRPVSAVPAVAVMAEQKFLDENFPDITDELLNEAGDK
jgi:hypothetical protein